ncbi:hypothetical protein CALVIDRAFT_560546 [Calocera viscosa TUFC12733]|uniref:Uncharacterized protein n=1 Tax=Calocera viscosa (strain TUFC12733) TaxID=1330018 RepID=A0A167R5S9_CALVF|nr:hypothetical protein CALVIDRAFT_560546 [Calocera viscosa TUFC12733]
MLIPRGATPPTDVGQPGLWFQLLLQLHWQCEDLQTAFSSDVAPSRDHKIVTVYGSKRSKLPPTGSKSRRDKLYDETIAQLQFHIWNTVSHLSETVDASSDLAGFPTLVTAASQRAAQNIHTQILEQRILSNAVRATNSSRIPGSYDGSEQQDDDLTWSLVDAYARAGLEAPHLTKRVAFFHAVEMMLDVIPLDVGLVPWFVIMESVAQAGYDARYVLCRVFERLASELVQSGFDKSVDAAIVSIFTEIQKHGTPTHKQWLYCDARELLFSAMNKCLKSAEAWLKYAGMTSFHVISKSMDPEMLSKCLYKLAMDSLAVDATRYPVFLLRTTEMIYDMLRRYFRNQRMSEDGYQPWLTLLSRAAVMLSRTPLRLPVAQGASFAGASLALCTYCRYEARLDDMEPDRELSTTTEQLAKVHKLDVDQFLDIWDESPRMQEYMSSLKSWGFNINWTSSKQGLESRTAYDRYQYEQEHRLSLTPTPYRPMEETETDGWEDWHQYSRKPDHLDTEFEMAFPSSKRPRYTSYPFRESSPDDLDLFEVTSDDEAGTFMPYNTHEDTHEDRSLPPSSDDMNLFHLATPAPPARRRTYTGSTSFKQRMVDAQSGAW